MSAVMAARTIRRGIVNMDSLWLELLARGKYRIGRRIGTRGCPSFEAFEEGSLRRSRKCLATLDGAQRGRSEPACNSGMTSPAAPNLAPNLM
jgi:hypothetical protein